MKKIVSMNENEGEARLWGDQETVEEVGRFFEKYQRQIVTLVEIRKVTGRDSATGLYEDFKRCYLELETKRANQKKLDEKKAAEDEIKKRRDMLKRNS